MRLRAGIAAQLEGLLKVFERLVGVTGPVVDDADVVQRQRDVQLIAERLADLQAFELIGQRAIVVGQAGRQHEPEVVERVGDIGRLADLAVQRQRIAEALDGVDRLAAALRDDAEAVEMSASPR